MLCEWGKRVKHIAELYAERGRGKPFEYVQRIDPARVLKASGKIKAYGAALYLTEAIIQGSAKRPIPTSITCRLVMKKQEKLSINSIRY